MHNKVREVRQALHLSQGEVARRSGFTLYAMRISLIEHGKVKPRQVERAMLAGILDQPEDYLFPTLPPRTPVAP